MNQKEALMAITITEGHPVWAAIDRGGGQTCDIAGVLRELACAGFCVVPIDSAPALPERPHRFRPPFEIYADSIDIADQDGHILTAESPAIAKTLLAILNSALFEPVVPLWLTKRELSVLDVLCDFHSDDPTEVPYDHEGLASLNTKVKGAAPVTRLTQAIQIAHRCDDEFEAAVRGVGYKSRWDVDMTSAPPAVIAAYRMKYHADVAMHQAFEDDRRMRSVSKPGEKGTF
jgi:hypothetical protein